MAAKYASRHPIIICLLLTAGRTHNVASLPTHAALSSVDHLSHHSERHHRNRAPKIVVVTMAEIDNPAEAEAAATLLENKKQYCARHGYDLLVADHQYPLFDYADTMLNAHDRNILEKAMQTKIPWLPSPWNIPATLIVASRIVLDRYDWVLYQQLDSMFINMNISLDFFTQTAPPDAHIVITANMGYYINDVTVLIRNSPQGQALLDRIIDLQKQMRNCPAPGMGVINTFFLHQLNGTIIDGNPTVYNQECERSCGSNLKTFDDLFLYKSYYECLAKWYKTFRVDGWHVRQVVIPGFWIIPGSTPAILQHQHPVLGDDIVPFGQPPMLNDGFSQSPWYDTTTLHYKTQYASEPVFCRRFPTTLSLHNGGSSRTPKAATLAKEVASIFDKCSYTERHTLVSDNLDIATRPGWTSKLVRFNTTLCKDKLLPDGTPFSALGPDEFTDDSKLGCRFFNKLAK